jgi:hypothetical protein
MDAPPDRAHVDPRDVCVAAPLDGVALRDHTGDDDRYTIKRYPAELVRYMEGHGK